MSKRPPPRDFVGKSLGGGSSSGDGPPGSSTLKLKLMSEVTPESVQWLWPGRLAAGKLTMLAGDAGLGKSTLSTDIASRISTGNAWPDGGRAACGSVVVLSAEDGLADTLRPRLDAADADVGRIRVMTALIGEDGARRTFDLAADLSALERAIAAISDVRLVIVDPVTSYMGRIDSHRTTDVRRVLEPLADFAERRKLAVLAISHPPKSAPTRALYAVTGSYAYVAAARIVLMVGADPNDEERRLLLPVKNNLAAPAVGLAFNVKGCTIGDGIVTSKVVWSADRVTVTADQMLAAGAAGAGSEAVTAKTDCVEFLRQVLAAGPKAYTDLEREACDAGLLEDGKSLSQSRPFRAARGALGIKPSQPKGVKAGGWVWALPEHQMPSDALTSERACDGARASDKVAVATDNISMDRPTGTTTVEEEAWTV